MSQVFTVGTFRTAFPEFQDAAKYSDQMITFWSTLASAQVDTCLWGTLWLTGVQLYTAHECVLAAQNAKSAANDGSPGQQGGIANTKTVGSVTVGYDASTSTEKDGGYWNLTTYGKQFLRLTRVFGAGAMQL